MRNAILFALALDATRQEVDEVVNAIYSQFNIDDGIDPASIADLATSDLPASNATVDGDGLPWDERIHSSSKKFTAKGVWGRRKNIDDALFNKVVAELKATLGSSPAAVTTSAAPMPGANAQLPMPGADLPLPGAAVPDPAFTELTNVIASNLATGHFKEDFVKGWLAHFGAADGNLQNAAANPAVVAAALAHFKQYAQ